MIIQTVIISTSECTLPAKRGVCNGRIKRYFYNSVTKTCELFLYSGCLGNVNKFRALHECEKACSGKYIILLTHIIVIMDALIHIDKPPTCSPIFCARERKAMCSLYDIQTNNYYDRYTNTNTYIDACMHSYIHLFVHTTFI